VTDRSRPDLDDDTVTALGSLSESLETVVERVEDRRIEGTVEGLDLKEFFLLLSSTGLAFRRCQLVRMDGDQIGVRFLERDRATKRSVKKQPTGEPV